MRSNWFSWKSWAVGTACGLALVVALGAQTPTGAVGRFQLQAWAHPGFQPGNGQTPEPGHHGAYRLDTQSGEVWEIHDDGSMMQLGKSN